MTQGTTPTISIQLPPDIPVSDLTDARLTLCQNGTEKKCVALADLTVDTDTNTLSLTLTQAETLDLSAVYYLDVQLKVNYNGTIMASQIASYDVNEILCRTHPI